MQRSLSTFEAHSRPVFHALLKLIFSSFFILSFFFFFRDSSFFADAKSAAMEQVAECTVSFDGERQSHSGVSRSRIDSANVWGNITAHSAEPSFHRALQPGWKCTRVNILDCPRKSRPETIAATRETEVYLEISVG